MLQDGKAVAYVSRALTKTEQEYAQIEKELLAILFALERFHTYVYGRKITVETDHKPLISIMKKALTSAPRRLQRMLLRLQHYNFDLQFKLGSKIVIADTLSRAFPAQRNEKLNEQIFSEEVANVNNTAVCYSDIVASEKLQTVIRDASKIDQLCVAQRAHIRSG